MTENTIEPTVSDTELKNIEASIVKQEQDKMAKVRAEAMDTARKELAKEMEFKKLQDEKVKLEATVAKQAEEKEDLRTTFAQKESEYKSQIGSPKGQINTQNPFAKPNTEDNGIDFKNLTKEQMTEINEASKDAFLTAHGLNSNWRK